jgi:hypothetical protein
MLLLGSIAKGVRSAGGTHIVGTLEALSRKPSSQTGIAAVSNPSVCDTNITLALHFRKMM